jgi:serine/threonine protein phosphatase PrpC
MAALPESARTVPAFEYEVEMVSECGPVREENQDVAAAWRGADPNVALVVVDGMGGAAGGREAAEIVARRSLEVIRERAEAAWPEVLSRALIVAHDAVLAAGRERARVDEGEQQRGMGATAVLAIVEAAAPGPRLHVAHVGDSRAYLFRGTSLFRLTRDHSLVGRLVADGLLSEEEALGHPDANVVLRALGQLGPLDPELQGGIPLAGGDMVLLATDGLHGVVSDARIRRCLAGAASPLEACQRLLAAALAAHSQDNITIGCLRVAADPVRRRPTRVEVGAPQRGSAPGEDE